MSCVDDAFYARANFSDFDGCRLRSCVGPFNVMYVNAVCCQTIECIDLGCGSNVLGVLISLMAPSRSFFLTSGLYTP